ARWHAFCEKREAIARETERLKSTWVNPAILERAEAERVLGKGIEREYSLFELLRRPEVRHATLMTLPQARPEGVGLEDARVIEQVEIQAKYQGYIDRQREEIARAAAYEQLALPDDLDFTQVAGLSREVQQKLAEFRPQTIGQASRIQGVTPAAISLLLIQLKRLGGKIHA
ncbi:MAG: tRNA uridine-5-carboxymethylaminomethyl(34) synthesis enzyme MnmG, partial [Zoogloeaceae bacterium]|nr:tRNA uridine-5-carboxymethylaminomethyl(34) synthesis enzyme MnmG [Zoogloeaceae bacterium]